MTLLILGGTAEARALAAAVVSSGRSVVSSLAGRVSNPALPEGETRIGGFGGVSGLVAYLDQHHVTAVIDTTHPFAATMTEHAAVACRQASVPLLRLSRPGWSDHPDAADWHWVDSLADARLRAEQLGSRPFLTTGRQSLPEFMVWADRAVLVRLVERPADPLPQAWRLVLSRGPYTLEGEQSLIASHRADVLLTKDSGGAYTEAKLTAARQAGIPVVIVRRPPAPPGVDTVTTVPEALTWLPNH